MDRPERAAMDPAGEPVSTERPEAASTVLDHAEARERLDALLFARGSLTTLGEDPSSEAEALRAHLVACPSCRRELAAVQTTGLLLANAAPEDLPLRLDVRRRVLQAVRQTGVPRGSLAPAAEVAPYPVPRIAGVAGVAGVAAPARRGLATTRRPTWFGGRLAAGLAAALAVVVLAGSVLVGRDLMQQRDVASAQVAALSHVATAADRLLAAPDHRQMTLRDAGGGAAGTVLFDPSSGELLVFSATLGNDVRGEPYDCFVEHQGQRTRIGWMEDAGSVAYWIGGVPAGTTLASGDHFVVETDDPQATPVLSGTF